MMGNTHEGWSNYETWVVNMYFSNHSERTYRWALSLARVTVEDIAERGKGDPVEELAYELRETFSPPQLDGPWHDLLTAALAKVDWRELAQEWLCQAKDAGK